MKKVIYVCLSAIMLLGLVACDPAKSAISDLESLVNKIEANHESYTQEDWDRIAILYSEIEEELAKHEYTDEQLKEIGRLKGKCVGFLTKKSLEDFEKQMKNLPKELEGTIEGFMDAFSNDNDE